MSFWGRMVVAGSLKENRWDKKMNLLGPLCLQDQLLLKSFCMIAINVLGVGACLKYYRIYLY